jgi:hypothetical protein
MTWSSDVSIEKFIIINAIYEICSLMKMKMKCLLHEKKIIPRDHLKGACHAYVLLPYIFWVKFCNEIQNEESAKLKWFLGVTNMSQMKITEAFYISYIWFQLAAQNIERRLKLCTFITFLWMIINLAQSAYRWCSAFHTQI